MATSNPSCGPCVLNGIDKAALKRCTNCEEVFCKDCEKTHKGTQNFRDHILIGIEDYGKPSNIFMKLTCEIHEKMLDSYCKAHDVPLCSSCALSQHKSCKDIIPLQEAAKNAKSSTALADLQETITVGLQNIQSIIQNTKLEDLDQEEKKIIKDIGEMRTKIIHRLDEMEQNLILKLKEKITKHRSKQSNILKHMKESEKTIKHLKDQTTEMKKMASDIHIFIGTRKINREVHECLNSTLKYNTIDKYDVNVEIDQILTYLLTDVKTFGKIHVELTKTTVPLSQPKIGQAQIHLHPVTKNVSEITTNLKQTFKIKKESTVMWISCTILPNGHLLIADYDGKNQLMQYDQNGTHVRDIPVSSKPIDVTVIDSDRVAVSYGLANYIEIINIQNTTVEQKVDLDNNARGLSYQGGKLYAVVKDSGVVVIGLSGKILNTIKIQVDSVYYLATTTDRLFYSENMKDTVTCCDMSGNQIWKFEDDSVISPRGVTVDNNRNVFVACRDSQNVTIISRDGKRSKTLLTESDGLCYPRAIYFNKDTGDLLVCNANDTKVFLYKVN